MAFDPSRTVELVRGSLFDEAPTWSGYAEGRHSLTDTLLWLTLPLVVVSALLAYLLNLIFSGYYLFGGSGIGSLFAGIIGGLLGVGIWAAAAYFFAGMFRGDAPPAERPAAAAAVDVGTEPPSDPPPPSPAPEPTAAPPAPHSLPAASFAQAFAAVSFGFIPGFIGSVLGTLPYIGVLLSLGAMIWALMTLYRALPVFLPIAAADRTKHFVATLLTSIVAFMVLGAILSAVFGGAAAVGSAMSSRDRDDAARFDYSEDAQATQRSATGADFLGVGHQVEYLEAAGNDTYDAPASGLLSEEQVKRTVHYLTVTRELRERTGGNLEALAERAESGAERPSLGDLFKGIKGAVTAGTAEMQAVKSGGGNWAEHEWIKGKLFEARLHQDLNRQTAHNYALYQQFEEQLDGLL